MKYLYNIVRILTSLCCMLGVYIIGSTLGISRDMIHSAYYNVIDYGWESYHNRIRR